MRRKAFDLLQIPCGQACVVIGNPQARLKAAIGTFTRSLFGVSTALTA